MLPENVLCVFVIGWAFLLTGGDVVQASPMRSYPEASALIAEADRLVEACRFDDAMEIYERVEEENVGRDVGAYATLRRGQTLARISEHDHAFALLRNLQRKHPGTQLACLVQLSIGQALLAKGEVKGDTEQAIRELVKVKQMLPDYSDIEPLTQARYTLGRLCTNHVKGREDVLDAVEHMGWDRNDTGAKAETLAMLAGYPGKKGRIDLAYPFVAKLERECPEALGETNWARTEVAVGYLRTVKNCNGEFAPLASDILSQVCESAQPGDDEAAIAHVWQARCLNGRGKFAEAVRLLRGAMEKFSNTAHYDEMLYELGYTLYRSGKIDEGRQVFEKLLSVKPYSSWVSKARYLMDNVNSTQEIASLNVPTTLEALINEAIAGYDEKWRCLAFVPADELPDNPRSMAMQIVAMAKEDQMELASPLLDRYASRHGYSVDDLERAKAEAALCSVRAAAAVGKVSREALHVLMLLIPEVVNGKGEPISDYHLSLVNQAIQVIRDVLDNGLIGSEGAYWADWIGGTYMQMHRYIEATQAFKDELEVPGVTVDDRARALYQLGVCYKARDYDKSAARCLNEVVEKWPGSKWANQAKGVLLIWSSMGD